jgi:prepilin-type processing-associated H-X9-DG protein
VDASNQRQMGLATSFYADDNDRFVPREGIFEPNRPEFAAWPAWAITLRPLIDGDFKPAYYLEDDLNDRFESAEYYQDPGRPPDDHPLNYVVNGFVFRAPGELATPAERGRANGRPASNLDRVRRPTEAIYITNLSADTGEDLLRQVRRELRRRQPDGRASQFYDIWAPVHVTGEGTNGLSATAQLRIAPEWYDRGPNCLFFDGHVELVEAERVRSIETWDDGDYRSWMAELPLR